MNETESGTQKARTKKIFMELVFLASTRQLFTTFFCRLDPVSTKRNATEAASQREQKFSFSASDLDLNLSTPHLSRRSSSNSSPPQNEFHPEPYQSYLQYIALRFGIRSSLRENFHDEMRHAHGLYRFAFVIGSKWKETLMRFFTYIDFDTPWQLDLPRCQGREERQKYIDHEALFRLHPVFVCFKIGTSTVIMFRLPDSVARCFRYGGDIPYERVYHEFLDRVLTGKGGITPETETLFAPNRCAALIEHFIEDLFSMLQEAIASPCVEPFPSDSLSSSQSSQSSQSSSQS